MLHASFDPFIALKAVFQGFNVVNGVKNPVDQIQIARFNLVFLILKGKKSGCPCNDEAYKNYISFTQFH
jgi:hypothetical protein